MANWPHPQKGHHRHAAGTHYKYTVHQDLKMDRVVQAEVRKALAAKRTPAERLARLDALLGKGVGAKKERARIARDLKAQAA